MEIIHLILGKANPDRMNGVNKVVFQLATEQKRAGKKVSVWGVTQSLKHDYPERNFETHLFQSFKNPFKIGDKLKKNIILKKEAVFHLHGGWIPLYSSLAKFFKKTNIRFVLTPHGAYNAVAMERSSLVKKIYYHLFEKNLLLHVHKVHSIGESEVVGLNELYPNQKSFLLPYGFDLPKKSDSITKTKDYVIGFVGRIDVHTKGLDVLIDAFKAFQIKHSDAHLWLIGDGAELEGLKQTVARNSIKNVTFYGKKFGNEKNDLIQRMNLFAHPSRNEGLPTSVLEAAAFGVPSVVTIATNVASYIAEYDAGFCIDKTDKDLLIDAFFKAYEVRNKIFSDNCSKMLEEKFSWEVLVDKYDELYN